MKIYFLLFPDVNLLLFSFFALSSWSGTARDSSRGSCSPPDSPLLLFIAPFQHEMRSSFPPGCPRICPQLVLLAKFQLRNMLEC